MRRRLRSVFSDKCYDTKSYDFTQNSPDMVDMIGGTTCFTTDYIFSMKVQQAYTHSKDFMLVKKDNNECGLYSVRKLCIIFTAPKIVYRSGAYFSVEASSTNYVYDVERDVLFKGLPQNFVFLELSCDTENVILGQCGEKMVYVDTLGNIVYSFPICSYVKNYIGIQRVFGSTFNIIDVKSGSVMAKLESENYGVNITDHAVVVFDAPDKVQIFHIEERNVSVACCICTEPIMEPMPMRGCGCTSICKDCQTSPCPVCCAIVDL
jgi:hypothetical protein